MVNVGAKEHQYRRAAAIGRLVCRKTTLAAIRASALPKGDVLTVAKIAAIQAVKRTSDLIPLCHPLPLDHIQVELEVSRAGIDIRCVVSTRAATGVEMEALTGVAVAALTLYDMCKAVDKTMHIEGIRVVEKLKV